MGVCAMGVTLLLKTTMKATLIRNIKEIDKCRQATLVRNTKEKVTMKAALIRNIKEIVKNERQP